MTPAEPEISVVVATHDRPRRVQALLESLRVQTLDPSRYEVIVVDDGSAGEATAAVLHAQLAKDGMQLHVIRRPLSAGPSVARNEGWRAARAPLIAFTDDDCVATPTWAEAGLRGFAEHPNAVLQGRVEMNPDELDQYNPFSHTLNVHELGAGFETANIFYPRALLERVGGFNEAEFRGPGGEDTDLAWRAIKTGAEAHFLSDAVVYHGVVPSGAIKRLRVAARWSESIKAVRMHPEIRERLTARVFWRYNHWLLFRFLIALLLPKRWGALRLMLAAPYVVHLTDRRTGPLLAPYLLALDAVEVLAVVRGAIRYRTFII